MGKIKFLINHSEIETDAHPSTVLLDFIRKEAHFHGTKEVCKEGDCGACTVLVGEKINGEIKYHSIASCLTPIGDIQGKHVVTVEGVNKAEGLNPIQDEFLKEGASQCGFCTPGFILSLTNFFINSPELSYQDALDAMDGNICRCTGYMSIKRAAKHLSKKYLPLLQKNNNRLSQLVEWEILPPYFNDIPAKLDALSTTKVTKEQDTTLIGGGTDLFVQRADDLLEEKVVFSSQDKNLSFIKEENNKIVLGGNTTVTEIRESAIIQKYFPDLKKHTDLISSTIIRNRASIAGNLVNASPIGDISIFLLALNAELTIDGKNGLRNINLKNFYSGYKTFDLQKDEVIKEISFEIPDKNTYFSFEKVSKRTYLDIASANTALQIKINGKNIIQAHVSGGGVWPYPLYLAKTSDFLKDKAVTSQNLKAAADILQTEIAPIDDVRGKKEYKALLLKQLFFAHFINIFPQMIKMEDLV
ncbi:MAG: FAD binding domain-containing protein [Spirochaetes bacterium]|nr:FAD binding domain-containing protein [Spirochaetota bacterium]